MTAITNIALYALLLTFHFSSFAENLNTLISDPSVTDRGGPTEAINSPPSVDMNQADANQVFTSRVPVVQGSRVKCTRGIMTNTTCVRAQNVTRGTYARGISCREYTFGTDKVIVVSGTIPQLQKLSDELGNFSCDKLNSHARSQGGQEAPVKIASGRQPGTT